MNDEMNNIPKDELTSQTEISSFEEMKDEVKELEIKNDLPVNNDISSTKKSTSSKKKDISSFAKISSAMMVSVAAVSVVGPAITNQTPSLTINFHEIVITDTTIAYTIEVSDPTASDLSIVLKNDFTKRVMAIDETVETGLIEGLTPNVKYSLEITMPGSFGSDKVLAKQEVRTLSVDDYRRARFDGVDGKCTCNEDGYFHFTMNYVDNLGAYQDIKAYLEDSAGNISECEFNEDLHSEQVIKVSDSALTGDTATLYITCNQVFEGETSLVTLFEAEYSI